MADLDSIDAKLDEIVELLDGLEQKIEAERVISRACTTCNGVGHLVTITNVGDQPQESQIVCPLCLGEGKISFGVQEAL